MSKQQVAFIGLGVMGYPMAGHLSKAGFQTKVYNRTSAKAKQWCEDYEGTFAETPAQAVEGADFVFICVGNDDDLRSVVYGDDGVLAGIKPGAILVDHTTASANVAREISEKAAVAFLDAPVSGGQAGAENGVLTVMVGGDQAAFDQVKPVIMSYARAAELLGAVGAGQLTKMVNQICIAGLVQGLAEGLNFAQKSGLDGAKVVDVISKGAAGSWQMENRGKTMLNDEFEFGFAVDWMRKDLGICIEESEKNGAKLDVTRIVNDYYGEIQEMGGGRWDTSSLLRRLTR
ncbi:MAG: 3-hydroxyisobutyrate dehydrogenase-like beta-hydroxyacid dehydrogenase [Gammaproteobacteria bacterium]|jgi:3-hydroxyisobutyrate dehydrogenase-like beta-hydroxyacid dehydrogenase